jgi:phage/plasmid-like protein (TIGR03299 family)
MPAEVETMFSAREIPWHRIGTVTPDVLKAAEAIKAGGLDWKVELKPLYVQGADPRSRIKVEGHVGVVRDSDSSVLGVVGNKYVPFQNVEAFQFFDNLVDDGEAKYETAGSLRNGKWIWLTAKMPQTIQIGGHDAVDMYLLLSTSHDGTKAIQVDVTPIRVVCATTLHFALKESKSRWSVRHLSTASLRLQEARETLGLTFKYMDAFQDEANDLLSQKFSSKQMGNLLDKVLPELPRTESVKETIVNAFNESPTLVDVRNTKWAAVNAIGEYYDWLRNPRTPQSQVLGSWTGIGRTQRNKALALLTN